MRNLRLITNTLANHNHLCQTEVAMRPFQAPNGLSHHGEPADEEEVIVLEEPEKPSGDEPRVARIPSEPSQKEIDAHEATHLPNDEWCEFCMAGHTSQKKTPWRWPGGARICRE